MLEGNLAIDWHPIRGGGGGGGDPSPINGGATLL